MKLFPRKVWLSLQRIIFFSRTWVREGYAYLTEGSPTFWRAFKQEFTVLISLGVSFICNSIGTVSF